MNFTSIKKWYLKEVKETEILFRSIPVVTVSLFVVSVISMNLLANKTILQLEWIALDAGILISWLSFMSMDMITKHFGPKASNKISILAAFINLLAFIIFFVASIIPSNVTDMDYTGFNTIFGGTWFILLGSTVAFIASAIINNILNWSLGKFFVKNPDGKLAYAVRCYVSTFIAQFFDNLIFSLIVFVYFAPIFWDGFHWTIIQCITCALTGAVIELLFEVFFSPIGYVIVTKWKKHNVGKEYFEYIEK